VATIPCCNTSHTFNTTGAELGSIACGYHTLLQHSHIHSTQRGQSRAARTRREVWSGGGASYFAFRNYVALHRCHILSSSRQPSESDFSTRASEVRCELSFGGNSNMSA
jgi:hypothetical protein